MKIEDKIKQIEGRIDNTWELVNIVSGLKNLTELERLTKLLIELEAKLVVLSVMVNN